MKVERKRMQPTVYTIEECEGCGLKVKRQFQQGDYVFKEIGECAKCGGGKVRITMIYAEYEKQQG